MWNATLEQMDGPDSSLDQHVAHAAETGDVPALRRLLRAAGRPAADGEPAHVQHSPFAVRAAANAPMAGGWRPVLWAAKGGRVGSLETLYEAGAELSATNDDGSNALHVAAACDRVAIAEWLRARTKAASVFGMGTGANPPAENLPALGAQTGSGATALHIAALCGHAGVLMALLDWPPAEVLKAARTRARVEDGGLCPLHVAAAAETLPCLRLLAQAPGGPDVTDGEGRTPLLLACERSKWRAAFELLELGAAIARDGFGRLPRALLAANSPRALCAALERAE
ncbi:ankyrin repeat-containing domain protein [Pavlovales sp. CCMP2436]|nr:ankyrin repeat-containing domain protein [Pavlovales sp. CCMP2436]